MLFLRLVKQMADAEGITETLKANDQMEWVGRMNSCRDRASETVYHQVIYTVRSHR
ncbi:TnpV protein [Hominenteromicrobium sp.]|uniref:TnpV protein n=1 Tax=Hominenteromicrobium sp. TaxID=3073581 RepID=UPI003AB25EFE